MIYMRNITITTAKSATYLENVGKYLLIVAVLVLALTVIVRGFNIAYDCGENGYVEDGQCVYE